MIYVILSFKLSILTISIRLLSTFKVKLILGKTKRRRATFSSPTLHYGESNTWECKNPTFAKVHLPCYKVMQDNAKGTVLVEDDGIIPKKTFCLDTGGSVEESDNIKGTGF